MENVRSSLTATFEAQQAEDGTTVHTFSIDLGSAEHFSDDAGVAYEVLDAIEEATADSDYSDQNASDEQNDEDDNEDDNEGEETRDDGHPTIGKNGPKWPEPVQEAEYWTVVAALGVKPGKRQGKPKVLGHIGNINKHGDNRIIIVGIPDRKNKQAFKKTILVRMVHVETGSRGNVGSTIARQTRGHTNLGSLFEKGGDSEHKASLLTALPPGPVVTKSGYPRKRASSTVKSIAGTSALSTGQAFDSPVKRQRIDGSQATLWRDVEVTPARSARKTNNAWDANNVVAGTITAGSSSTPGDALYSINNLYTSAPLFSTGVVSTDSATNTAFPFLRPLATRTVPMHTDPNSYCHEKKPAHIHNIPPNHRCENTSAHPKEDWYTCISCHGSCFHSKYSPADILALAAAEKKSELPLGCLSTCSSCAGAILARLACGDAAVDRCTCHYRRAARVTFWCCACR